jgi:spore coat protein SA
VIYLRIAYICTEKLTVPAITGGAIQQYIDGILPYISKFHNVTVFCLAHHSLSNDETIDGIHYIRVSGKDKEEYIRNVTNSIENKFDLVHVFNRPLWIPILNTKLKKTKFSLSLHNEMFLQKKITSSSAITCIKTVQFITTVSKFVADGVRNLYPIADNKLHVVYSGVDVEKYQPNWSEQGIKNRSTLKEKLKIDSPNIVLYVSRLCPNKGSDIVLKAMNEVMDKRNDVTLVVIGSKWYGENNTDEFIQSLYDFAKKMKGNVIFSGFIPPSELASYFNLGDLFICASQWDEPLARVHYEAMAAGLPIITTDRGGNTEVVARAFGNGLEIKDYSNPSAFSHEINYLLDNQDVALALGRAGRKYALELYNWERVASELLKLFESIKR